MSAPPAELVTAAYMLGELAPETRLLAADALWNAARRYLVLVEPGTPEAFSQMLQIRARLVARGARVVAPCAQEGPCPLADGWCHFACRVERSALHKRLKGGDAAYEDEKFTYLIFARNINDAPLAGVERVLRHPVVEKGRIGLTLCAPGGVVQRTVTRRDGAAFTAARKLRWGDALPAPDGE